MNTKQQFLKAVEILAPGDNFILEAARQVPIEDLSSVPGWAALKFVVTLEKLRDRMVGQADLFLRIFGRQHHRARRWMPASLPGRRPCRSTCVPLSVRDHPQWPVRIAVIGAATSPERPGALVHE